MYALAYKIMYTCAGRSVLPLMTGMYKSEYIRAHSYTDRMGSDEHSAVEMSIADLRRNMAAAISGATDHDRITFITSRGRRVAVIGPLSLSPAIPASLADEFERLYALVERGVLTAAEFEQAKRRLLAD